MHVNTSFKPKNNQRIQSYNKWMPAMIDIENQFDKFFPCNLQAPGIRKLHLRLGYLKLIYGTGRMTPWSSSFCTF